MGLAKAGLDVVVQGKKAQGKREIGGSGICREREWMRYYSRGGGSVGTRVKKKDPGYFCLLFEPR